MKNEIIIHDDYAEVVLAESGSFGVSGIALVDLEVVDKIRLYKWYARVHQGTDTVYAAAHVRIPTVGPRIVNMSRVVLGPVEKGMRVWHINGNSLDYRADNLEVLSVQEYMVRKGEEAKGFRSEAPRWTEDGKKETELVRRYRAARGLPEKGRLPRWAAEELKEILSYS